MEPHFSLGVFRLRNDITCDVNPSLTHTTIRCSLSMMQPLSLKATASLSSTILQEDYDEKEYEREREIEREFIYPK